MSRLSMAKIREQHFGSDHYGGHVFTSEFDFYCVAHDSDYSPKYLNGEYCHDGDTCHPDCRPCMGMIPCPIVPCPLPDEDAAKLEAREP